MVRIPQTDTLQVQILGVMNVMTQIILFVTAQEGDVFHLRVAVLDQIIGNFPKGLDIITVQKDRGQALNLPIDPHLKPIQKCLVHHRQKAWPVENHLFTLTL